MHARCENDDREDFPNYGGRGIAVCERWFDISKFLADMGPRPSKRHSIDRIDCNLGYSPDNCRWATPAMQSRNRRCVSLTHELLISLKDWKASGKPVREWARQNKVKYPAALRAVNGHTWVVQ
jgi:hypothetical protein